MKRILIVDGSRVARKMIRNALELAGFEVVAEAINGKEGLELFEKLQPDVVIMDNTMPEMNGLEATRAIKQQSANVKVIVISALGADSKKIEAIKAGAEIYITKPYDNKDIIDAINNC